MTFIQPIRPVPGAQQQLDFLLALFRPLLTVDEACYLLADPSPQMVIRRLEDGTLRGVDISSAGEASGRRELRIYRYSVERLYCPAKVGRLVHVPVERIFPHERDVFRRDEVAKLLNCTAKHVGNLELDGPRLSSAAAKSSAERTPRVSRHSLITFLTEREITA